MGNSDAASKFLNESGILINIPQPGMSIKMPDSFKNFGLHLNLWICLHLPHHTRGISQHWCCWTPNHWRNPSSAWGVGSLVHVVHIGFVLANASFPHPFRWHPKKSTWPALPNSIDHPGPTTFSYGHPARPIFFYNKIFKVEKPPNIVSCWKKDFFYIKLPFGFFPRFPRVQRVEHQQRCFFPTYKAQSLRHQGRKILRSFQLVNAKDKKSHSKNYTPVTCLTTWVLTNSGGRVCKLTFNAVLRSWNWDAINGNDNYSCDKVAERKEFWSEVAVPSRATRTSTRQFF